MAGTQKNNKRHPCNKRHSGHSGEKEIKDTQSIKRHSGHSREWGVGSCESFKCLRGRGRGVRGSVCLCLAQNGINVKNKILCFPGLK